MRLPKQRTVGCLLMLACILFIHRIAQAEEVSNGEGLKIEIAKKGLGREVIITRGQREWFMMVEVTPENTVVIRQEKDGDRYLVDESETHDRPLTSSEVEAAISDYINSVKTRADGK